MASLRTTGSRGSPDLHFYVAHPAAGGARHKSGDLCDSPKKWINLKVLATSEQHAAIATSRAYRNRALSAQKGPKFARGLRRLKSGCDVLPLLCRAPSS